MDEKNKIEIKEETGLLAKLDKFLLNDVTFILLVMGAAAAIFAGTFLYFKFGTGAFNEIAIVEMLPKDIHADASAFSAAAGFAAGFLIARILEGPLVGILDIGGSLLTGVGIGIPALLLSMGITLPFDNIVFALISGAVIGVVIGSVVMLIRKFMPDGVAVGGTEVMMGAGNASGRYLAPMIIIAAGQFHAWTGIGALIGSVIFYKWNKEMTGGAIIGAMIAGAIALHFNLIVLA